MTLPPHYFTGALTFVTPSAISRTWINERAKENSKLKLLKQMRTKKKKKTCPPLKGCFEYIWSVWWLLCDSYHLCLSKQGTYPECHLSAEVHYAREFSTVTQFLVYPCARASLSTLQDCLDVYVENMRVRFDVCGKYWNGKCWNKHGKWCWACILTHSGFWIFSNVINVNIFALPRQKFNCTMKLLLLI